MSFDVNSSCFLTLHSELSLYYIYQCLLSASLIIADYPYFRIRVLG
jgi:hypothetical protein